MPSRQRRALRRLSSESLECRHLLANNGVIPGTGLPISSLGVAGDDLSDEYAVETYNYGRSWTEVLHDIDSLNLGPAGSYAEPRRDGYAYNWARSGADSTTLLADG